VLDDIDMKAVATTYRARLQAGESRTAAHDAAIEVYLNRHPTKNRPEADRQVALLIGEVARIERIWFRKGVAETAW
jgi:hypothetical protein